MSAFIVTDKHLNALVNVALFGVIEATAASGRWWVPYFDNPSRKLDVFNADRLGVMLAAENEASYYCRYPRESRPSSTPTFRYRMESKRVSAVAALKLIHCYEYQSCEHPAWETSASKKFCGQLKDALIRFLDGYDAAPWAIE